MAIPSAYDPGKVEDKWYKYWMEQEVFSSVPDEREAYTVVIPPPNVTGILHMGHMLNNTIQDVLVRKARMEGKNACWVPGTDHASIATEAKVVNKLHSEGINKDDLTREEFLEHAWEWTHKHGGIILEQLKKLGASCDWSRTKFTMDPEYSEQVIKVFIDLFEKGFIYRGVRMINWDPKAQTALSDEEVNYKEVNSKLYHIAYQIKETGEHVVVATTRPETLLGDTAVCVNPNDPRYKHLHGKTAIVPVVNREVPVITDEYVDLEFGTGVLKVTPAHDENDYKLGIKHNLEVVDIFHDNGQLNEHGAQYAGMDRFEVRKQIAKDLKANGQLLKEEDLVNKVGYSERTDVVIEPKLSLQWFCKMEDLSKPALEHVMDDTIQFVPAKFKNTYKHWMENIRDWCISRQLWWGHQIPAYFYGNGANDFVVAKTPEEALTKAIEKSGRDLTQNDLTQDPDVMDTWFSSWLWPMAVFNGISDPENDEINYYYPTNDLVTAPEIMFFWVARMIISGYEYRGKYPFKNVYYTGIVRDSQRRKMSKQLGNSPDPIELMKVYGADGVRIGMLLSSPAGNDILFEEKLCEQGRNFSNKLWNAFRLIKGWEIDTQIEQPTSATQAIQWFENRLNQAFAEISDHFSKFRISDALMSAYKLIWDDFCSWYLEAVKPAYGEAADPQTVKATEQFLGKLLHIMHPFTPFITEEIWSYLKSSDDACLAEENMPKMGVADAELVEEFEGVKEVVTAVRNFRAKQQMGPREAVSLHLSLAGNFSRKFDELVMKLANLSDFTEQEVEGTHSTFMVGTAEFAIPMQLDEQALSEQKEQIEEELKYTKGFLSSVVKKLSNARFVDNAPAAVVEKEQQKRTDAEAKIKALEEQLSALV